MSVRGSSGSLISLRCGGLIGTTALSSVGQMNRGGHSRLPQMPAVSAEQRLFSLDGVQPELVAEVSHNSWPQAVSALHTDHIT